jgi:hypothetical protein
VAAASPHGSAAATPRCFGAADRDPQHPCYNPALRLKVTPTPDVAQLTPNLVCRTLTVMDTVSQCGYGAPAGQAAETVALIGDSHAAALRAAMAVVAQAKRWRVLELATPHCPFSQALPDSGQAVANWCPGFNGRIQEYLHAHPEIRTVVFSANANAPIVTPPGERIFDHRLAGYLSEWELMPASVTRIIVVRDDPIDKFGTPDCIRNAMAKHRPPGPTCAVPRSYALPPDAEVAAAKLLADRGGRVVDLTDHYCAARRCYPVIGGVLVHKDQDHLGQLWARTLGPYLLRGINALSWPAGT